jgi:hypothetical protein
MTSAVQNSPQLDSIAAGADLSSNQFLLHKINTSGQLVIAATRGERVHGVLQNEPAAQGRAASIAYGGLVRVKAGGTFQEGVDLTTDASGQAIEATLSSDVVWGTSKEAGVSGAYISAYYGVAGGYLTSPGTIIAEDFTGYAATDDPPLRAVAGTIATGTAGNLNLMQSKDGTKLGYWIIGTQTILGPVGGASCLDIGMDQTDNDGVELFSSVYPASGAPFVVGTSPAFYFEVGLNFALANGTDDLFIGFRKEESAYQGTMTGYDTYFGLGNDTAASPMALKVREELNGAAGASTDTTDTQADATDLWVGVYVSAAGVATVKHADTRAALAAPTVTSAFTFDTGDHVVPTVRFLQANAAQTGVVKLLGWYCGPQ